MTGIHESLDCVIGLLLLPNHPEEALPVSGFEKAIFALADVKAQI